jgi:hypothetical protein
MEDNLPSAKEMFDEAVKIVKLDSDVVIPAECPPEPLWGEEIDNLLNSKDDSKFISRVKEVF